MYEEFFGLREQPFGMTPDPRFLYLSRGHKEALARLIYGVNERKGFVEITGEVGVGKTILSRALLRRLDKGAKVSFVTNTRLTPTELLLSILNDLDVKIGESSKGKLLTELNNVLHYQLVHDSNVVVVVDEAQNLDFELLEELRMLSNLETDTEKLIQILLLGQPELIAKLNDSRLAQLKQRISIQYHIAPLNREETSEYIHHRLKIAGYSGTSPLFTQEAEDKIFEYSRGLPRSINSLCDNALLTGYVRETKEIAPDVIVEVIDELEGIESHG